MFVNEEITVSRGVTWWVVEGRVSRTSFLLVLQKSSHHGGGNLYSQRLNSSIHPLTDLPPPILMMFFIFCILWCFDISGGGAGGAAHRPGGDCPVKGCLSPKHNNVLPTSIFHRQTNKSKAYSPNHLLHLTLTHQAPVSCPESSQGWVPGTRDHPLQPKA